MIRLYRLCSQESGWRIPRCWLSGCGLSTFNKITCSLKSSQCWARGENHHILFQVSKPARTRSLCFVYHLSWVMRSGTFLCSSGHSMRPVQCIPFNAHVTMADPWEHSERGSWSFNSKAQWRQQCWSHWAPTARLEVSCIVFTEARSGCSCGLDSIYSKHALIR